MEKQTESGKSSFTITGLSLTRIARDFVEDGEWEKAVDLLKDSLEGISYEEVYAVLSGALFLKGDSNMGLDLEIDSDSKEYQDKVLRQFSSVVRFRAPETSRTGWYRPVSYWVWTRQSILNLGEALRLSGEEMTIAHALWYSSNRTRDALIQAYARPSEVVVFVRPKPAEWPNPKIGSSVAVFFESCDAPPPWIRGFAPETPLASFLEARKKGFLREVKEGESCSVPKTFPCLVPRCSQVEKVQTEVPYPVWDGRSSPVQKIKSGFSPTFSESPPSEEQVEHARRQIIKQADQTGWMELGPYRVPRGAFECWALRHTKRWREASPWSVMSGEAWKQNGDDPYHTDWLLGAGFGLEDWQKNTNIQKLAEKARFVLEYGYEEPLFLGNSYPMMTFVGSNRVIEGQVIHPKPNTEWYKAGGQRKVVVLPNLHPNYVQALTGASAVISEVGSSWAHLIILVAEKGLPFYRLDEAREKLPEGCFVRIENSLVEVLELSTVL